MKQINFVTGWPRCRLAWLSELLTQHGHSFALHEGAVMFGGDRGALLNAMMARPEPIVIDCSSSHLGDTSFMRSFKDARVAFIDAPWAGRKAAHAQSLEVDPGIFNAAWGQMLANYDSVKRRAGVMCQMKDLDNEEVAQWLVEYLAPGFQWDSLRYQQLRLKRITQNIPLALSQLRENGIDLNAR